MPKALPLTGLRKIFKAPGRVLALIALGLLILLRAGDSKFVQAIAMRGFDREQQVAPRAYKKMPVYIVAIDEQSLSRLGQWPWPRTLVAKLVRTIATGKPRALGVDIIFAEADRLSPGSLLKSRPDIPLALARELALLAPNETALVEAFKEVPTVLAIGALDETVPGKAKPWRVTIVRETGGDPRRFLTAYPYFLRSLPELTAAVRGQGAVLDNPDPDGMTRRLPLYVIDQKQLAPAFALEMLRVASGTRTLGIRTGRTGVEGGSVAGEFIPTDGHGRAYPYFTRSYESRYISAADLLDGSFNPGALHDGLVLLGVTGQGLIDERQTPLGLMAGVEVHAQLIECIIDGNLLRRPATLDWIETALILIAGLVTIFALPYRRPRIAGVAFMVLVLLLFGSAFGCFRFLHLLVDAVWPTIGAVVTFGVMLGASLRSAEAARRRLAVELEHEREMEARVDGELSAARSIQMGLLPRHFPGPPERRDIDLYALIEPARMIGGDLYDFLLLDSNRLFFAIADVSGKGVPAALFMAMTKEVLRDATARHDKALDRVLGEANAKISASGDDMAIAGGNMMFVTVFAGILDLTSGMLAYVNAGHESPFLLSAGVKPAELGGAGGPPLGTVDDFQYPVELRQLTSGDSLLLYTDGVTEAENPNDLFYTVARLELLLTSAPTASAKGLVELVREDIRQFADTAEQADDITLLALRWTGAEVGTS